MVACFLPAVDKRSRHTGDVRYPGLLGWFWSSTPYGTISARVLRITSTDVFAGVDNANPPWGFSVRCVQELTEEKSGLNFSSFVLRD